MKTYVIALTTYREMVRRPFFWGVLAFTCVLLWLFDFIPYYTLGEDIKMVKDQGLEVIMIAGLVISLFAASVSIADEIEGKTAITLLSKPITRRDFIVGKYLGIMAAVALLFVLLSINFAGVLMYKMVYDARESAMDRPDRWACFQQFIHITPGLVLMYFKVMILTAISVALSTRFPIHLNITACIVILLLGHLAPRLVQAEGQNMNEAVIFMAQLFALILPGLEYFSVGPAISTDANVPWLNYVLPSFVYAMLYTVVALLAALLMFEDRDLA